MTSFAQWGNQLYSGERSYGIVRHRRVFLGIGLGAIVLAVLLIAFRGLNPSIEFTGGSQFELTGIATQAQQPAYDALARVGVRDAVRVSDVGSSGLRVQAPSLDSDDTHAVRQGLAQAYGVDQNDVQATSIGPTWGQDVTRKGAQSLVIFIAIITVLMAAYFRSWTMSAAAMVALVHDVFLTVGFFALTQVEVSPSSLIGFLTILGYSLYDTVVVFDKVRELTRGVYEQQRYTLGELVNLAVNQTLVRSINTSVVALLPVASILFVSAFLLGGGTLEDISLALFVGIIAGTFSSIFIASPLLVALEYRRRHVREHLARVHAARSGQGEDGQGGEDVRVSPVVPGHHLGQAAQPKRKHRREHQQ